MKQNAKIFLGVSGHGGFFLVYEMHMLVVNILISKFQSFTNFFIAIATISLCVKTAATFIY